MDLCWQNNVSAFYMLSRLVITFFPRSKCLLISRLQSPSAVSLKNKRRQLCKYIKLLIEFCKIIFSSVYLKDAVSKSWISKSKISLWSEGWTNTTRRVQIEQSRHLGCQRTSESVMGPITGSAHCSYSLRGCCFFPHTAQTLPSSRGHALAKVSYS